MVSRTCERKRSGPRRFSATLRVAKVLRVATALLLAAALLPAAPRAASGQPPGEPAREPTSAAPAVPAAPSAPAVPNEDEDEDVDEDGGEDIDRDDDQGNGVRRPLPDYDGRPPEPSGAGERLLWVPRVLFYPVHLFMEYGLRRPIVAAIHAGEKHHVAGWARWLFTWRDGTIGLFPTFLFEYGRKPTLGAYFFYDEPRWPGMGLDVRASVWPGGWVRANSTLDLPVFGNGSGELRLRGGFFTRPDLVFYGIGPDTRQSDKGRYRETATDVSVEARRWLSGLNRLRIGLSYRDASFASGDFPPIVLRHDVLDPRQVPGFITGYSLFRAGAAIELDTRAPYVKTLPRPSGTGVRLELFGDLAIGAGNGRLSFGRWGAEGAGFLDLGANHVIGLRVNTMFVERIGPQPVPFTELAALGGEDLMRGFWYGRFRGDSTLVATIEYNYPVWSYLDATLFFEAGNAFDGHYQDISFGKLFLSWGFGVRTTVRRDLALQFMLGFGTNRLDSRDVGVEQVHVLFGVNRGF